MFVESVILSNHLIFCHPLLLLPSIFPSIRVFSNESALCIRWPKYWSFSFSISPSNEYSGLISFRIDWFNLLAVQGTLKSLLQHHSLKASILQCSDFFVVQLSHLYMTTKKYLKFIQRKRLHEWKYTERETEREALPSSHLGEPILLCLATETCQKLVQDKCKYVLERRECVKPQIYPIHTPNSVWLVQETQQRKRN